MRNSAFSKNSSVSSGISPYSPGPTLCASSLFKSVPIARLLAVICFPHRDDMSPLVDRRAGNWRPGNDHHAASEESNGDEASFWFRITEAFVAHRIGPASENMLSIDKVQPALFERVGPFCWIEGN